MTTTAVLSRTTERNLITGLSLCHLLNDLVQSILLAIYPLLKADFTLSYTQLGLLSMSYQLTASLMQPLIGNWADRYRLSALLPAGMLFTLAGLLTLAFAPHYAGLLMASLMLGLGSAIFHPEAARLVRLSSAHKPGLAQSLFQFGGNLGGALGPLLVVALVLPAGRSQISWFALATLAALLLILRLAPWQRAKQTPQPTSQTSARLNRQQRCGLALLFGLMLVKWLYLACFSNFYLFYLMQHFALDQNLAQIGLFLFLAAVAGGTILGGWASDHLGARSVILASFVLALPFSLAATSGHLILALPAAVLSGAVLASAFPVMVVYAQDLIPNRVGAVSGLLFGLAFGLGGIGAAALGVAVDHFSLRSVFWACSLLPLIGVLAYWLPSIVQEGRDLRAETVN
ncbi:MFS transporter [Saccharospirillum sp. HFRX-1]|uniref:MFS transporter n=1 Tax=unclassified Saccharospirillum TaxID=2633430 RepID=UPI00371E12AB